MNLPNILLWGFVATIVLTMIMASGQWMGWSRMSVPFLLGTMLTTSRDRAMLIGSLFHMLNGWVFSLIYALAFESTGLANAWWGAAIGLVHALFVLTVGMPLLPSLHPRMARETQGPDPAIGLEPPGFMALHYGRRTPLITLLAHLAYGAVLGAFYRLAPP